MIGAAIFIILPMKRTKPSPKNITNSHKNNKIAEQKPSTIKPEAQALKKQRVRSHQYRPMATQTLLSYKSKAEEQYRQSLLSLNPQGSRSPRLHHQYNLPKISTPLILQLQSQVSLLQSQNIILEKDLLLQQDRYTRLQAQIQNLAESKQLEVSQLAAQVYTYKKTILKLEQELEVLDKKKKEMQVRVSDRERRYEQLLQEYGVKQVQCQGLHKEIDIKQEYLTSIMTQLNSHKEESHINKDNLQKFKLHCLHMQEGYERKVYELNRQLQQYRQRQTHNLKDKQEVLQIYEQEREERKTIQNAYKEQIINITQQYQARLQKMHKEIDSMTQQLNKQKQLYEQTVAENQDTRNKQQEQIEGLSRLLEAKRAESEQLKRKLIACTEQMQQSCQQTLQFMSLQHQKSVSNLEVINTESQSRLAQLETQLGQLQTQLHQKQKSIQNLQNERNHLCGILQDKTKLASQLKRDIVLQEQSMRQEYQQQHQKVKEGHKEELRRMEQGHQQQLRKMKEEIQLIQCYKVKSEQLQNQVQNISQMLFYGKGCLEEERLKVKTLEEERQHLNQRIEQQQEINSNIYIELSTRKVREEQLGQEIDNLRKSIDQVSSDRQWIRSQLQKTAYLADRSTKIAKRYFQDVNSHIRRLS